MKKIISFLFILMACQRLFSQPAYIRTFGKMEAPPVIFLHGGPGYNSANFESTTAEKLAANGYFVIVYDRSGEGRSEGSKAAFSFQESFDDLNNIMKKFDLSQTVLVGHGFGGMLATMFTEKFPDKVQSLVLVSTPVSIQESYKTIIRNSKAKYEASNDTVNLMALKKVEKTDSSLLSFSSECFNHAMINMLYSISRPSDEAIRLYTKFREDTANIKYVYKYTYDAPQGFYSNDKYTTVNLTAHLNKIKDEKKKVFAIYGKLDGTIPASEVEKMKTIIGPSNVKYFDECGYNAFIDQQTVFLDAISSWCK